MKNLIIIIALCLVCAACKKESAYTSTPKACISLQNISSTADVDVACRAGSPVAEPDYSMGDDKIEIQKKIVKTAFYEIEVKELNKEKIKIDSLIKSFQAYYESDNYENYQSNESFSFQINVPSERFDEFISILENGGNKLIRRQISVSDKSEEYYDLDSRLANKKAYLLKYRDLLSKAKTIKDILEIQEKIRELEEDLESAQNSLIIIDKSVKYSSLNLRLRKEQINGDISQEKPNIFSRLLNSISKGWNNFLDLLLFLVEYWYNVLLFLFTIIYIKRIFRKRQEKKQIKIEF